MKNNTGFYRVTKTKYSYKTSKGTITKYRWKYQVNNELIKTEITSTDLLKLKIKVLDAHLNWGIINLEQATKTANEEGYNIKDLEGEYGEKVI